MKISPLAYLPSDDHQYTIFLSELLLVETLIDYVTTTFKINVKTSFRYLTVTVLFLPAATTTWSRRLP